MIVISIPFNKLTLPRRSGGKLKDRGGRKNGSCKKTFTVNRDGADAGVLAVRPCARGSVPGGCGKIIIKGGTYTQTGEHKRLFASQDSPIVILSDNLQLPFRRPQRRRWRQRRHQYEGSYNSSKIRQRLGRDCQRTQLRPRRQRKHQHERRSRFAETYKQPLTFKGASSGAPFALDCV